MSARRAALGNCCRVFRQGLEQVEGACDVGTCRFHRFLGWKGLIFKDLPNPNHPRILGFQAAEG